MSSAAFPEHVEEFVNDVRRFLAEFDLELPASFDEQNTSQPARTYELANQNWKTTLVVHQTSRSIGSAPGEFRARASIELPDSLACTLTGMEDVANQFASLGALVVGEGRASVVCQSLIRENSQEIVAAVMSAAIAHAAPAIVQSMARVLGTGALQTVRALSAWSDLDFEQIHYDHAHLGMGAIGRREWSQSLLGGSKLTLQAVDNNPYWGGGLLIGLRCNPDFFRHDEDGIAANELNQMSWLFDDAPAFGAWCRREGDLLYVSFAPNFLKQVHAFTDFMIASTVARAMSVRQLVGLAIEARSLAGRLG